MKPIDLELQQALAEPELAMLVASPPVVFQRSFIDITGSVLTAVLLSGYVDIQDATPNDHNGWFEVPDDEIKWRTGLSDSERQEAESTLISKKLIDIKAEPYKPNKYLARVDFDQISIALITYAKNAIANRAAAQSKRRGGLPKPMLMH